MPITSSSLSTTFAFFLLPELAAALAFDVFAVSPGRCRQGSERESIEFCHLCISSQKREDVQIVQIRDGEDTALVLVVCVVELLLPGIVPIHCPSFDFFALAIEDHPNALVAPHPAEESQAGQDGEQPVVVLEGGHVELLPILGLLDGSADGGEGFLPLWAQVLVSRHALDRLQAEEHLVPSELVRAIGDGVLHLPVDPRDASVASHCLQQAKLDVEARRC